MKLFMRICILIDIIGILMASLNNNMQSIVVCGFCGVILSIISNDCDNI